MEFHGNCKRVFQVLVFLFLRFIRLLTQSFPNGVRTLIVSRLYFEDLCRNFIVFSKR